MDYSLKGKKAVVCGASSGIGFGAAIKLASEGSDVIIVSRSEENLLKAKKKIKDVTGHEAHSFACDISISSEIEKLISYIKEKFGSADILVNNVGGPEPMAFLKVTDETWFRYFETLFMSVVRLTRSFVPLMREGSSIVNILSFPSKTRPLKYLSAETMKLSRLTRFKDYRLPPRTCSFILAARRWI